MPRIPLEKFGTVGTVIAAAACPICFPKVALIGALFGFGAFAVYEEYFVLAVQAMAAVAFVGQAFAFRRHRNRWLLALSAVCTILLFVAYYVLPSTWLMQGALVGVVVASVWLVIELRRCAKCNAADENQQPDSGIAISGSVVTTVRPD